MYAAGRSARSRISWPVLQLIRGEVATGSETSGSSDDIFLECFCAHVHDDHSFWWILWGESLGISDIFLPSFLSSVYKVRFAHWRCFWEIVGLLSIVQQSQHAQLTGMNIYRFNSLHDVPCSSRRSSPIRTQSRPLQSIILTLRHLDSPTIGVALSINL
jgi:hypothetical protein